MSDGPRLGLGDVLLLLSAIVLGASLGMGDRTRPMELALRLGGLLGILTVLVLRDRGARRDLAQLEEVVDAREAELRMIHAFSREVLATRDTLHLVTVLERECRKVLPVDRFLLVYVDADPGSSPHPVRPQDPTDERTPSIGPLEAEILRRVAFGKRPLRIDDLTKDPVHSPLAAELAVEPIRSLVAVPLLVNDRVLGVLSLGSRRPAAYDADHLELVTTIGQQAAAALESAQHSRSVTVDSLSGLFLRDYFFRRLEEEYHRASRYGASFALLMLDLDGFKEINDRHGHLAGDRYLRDAGAIVRATLRSADLACRYGGDEFCVMLPETDCAGAEAIADRVRLAISGLITDVEGVPVRTTASIGVAVHPLHNGGTMKGLLRAADEALYRAKRAGRDLVRTAA